MVNWHIGNTTVRTPYRLREALILLSSSKYHGNLVGKNAEEGFACLLHEQGVVNSARLNIGDKSTISDLVRKWRSALAQLGFLTQHFQTGHKQGIDNKLLPFVKEFPKLSGRPYEITDNGWRLIEAESIQAQQECFLRALLAYRLPSIIETRYKKSPYNYEQFSPLRFILEILYDLEQKNATDCISFSEFACIIQCKTPSNGIPNVVEEILEYRKNRGKSSNKSKYDKKARKIAVIDDDPTMKDPKNYKTLNTRIGTLNDYADLTLRYLKASGLFRSQGRGITIVQEKQLIVTTILEKEFVLLEGNEYLSTLWCGATLPTDNKAGATKAVHFLASKLDERGKKVSLPMLETKSTSDLSIIRHNLESELQQLNELEFAREQASRWSEILEYMEEIVSKKKGKLIPKSEGSAYF